MNSACSAHAGPTAGKCNLAVPGRSDAGRDDYKKPPGGSFQKSGPEIAVRVINLAPLPVAGHRPGLAQHRQVPGNRAQAQAPRIAGGGISHAPAIRAGRAPGAEVT
jgi:hypothetical protein